MLRIIRFLLILPKLIKDWKLIIILIYIFGENTLKMDVLQITKLEPTGVKKRAKPEDSQVLKVVEIKKDIVINEKQEEYSEFVFVISLVVGIMIACMTQYLYEDTLFQYSLELIPKLMVETSPDVYNALKFYSSVIGGGHF